ncbi:lipase (class 3) domain-containing protein [Ditylenchus destructor]|uniref:Lipase (Class 3) domain-containing protein n=1 Tax=Ditylenchus destructor TaxID=166010 RepID=A0AAD4N480_9BILA|nr:lipase (class 3) domain-containing protein [Ditylenchus destructor]
MFAIIFVCALQNILLGTGVEASVPAYSHSLGTQLVHLIAGAYGQDNEQKSCIKKFAKQRFGSSGAARFLNRHPVADCDGYGNQCSMYVVEVNRYFMRVFLKLWPFVEGYITAYKSHELWFLGHSLGGAVAALAAFLTRVYDLRRSSMVKVITLGQPRVGNPKFATEYDSLVPNTDRVVNGLDIVSHFQSKMNGYYHHGREKWYNRGTNRSQFIDCTGKPTNEDLACSNSHNFGGLGLIFKSGDHFATHRTYFGHWLWFYGDAGCDDNLEQEKIAGESPDEALAYNNPEDAVPW